MLKIRLKRGTKTVVMQASLETAEPAFCLDTDELVIQGSTSKIILARADLNNVEGSQILSKLLPVDGSGSGLDADLLDGNHASSFALVDHTHELPDVPWSKVINTPTTLAGYGITDAYSKNDVDSMFSTLNAKKSVRVATTESIDLSSAPSSIDGVTLSVGDRILVKDQTSSQQNGIYVFNGAGNALSRATDADTWSKLISAYVFVEEGATNADTLWVCTVDRGGTLGTSPVTWTLYSGGGSGSGGGQTDALVAYLLFLNRCY